MFYHVVLSTCNHNPPCTTIFHRVPTIYHHAPPCCTLYMPPWTTMFHNISLSTHHLPPCTTILHWVPTIYHYDLCVLLCNIMLYHQLCIMMMQKKIAMFQHCSTFFVPCSVPLLSVVPKVLVRLNEKTRVWKAFLTDIPKSFFEESSFLFDCCLFALSLLALWWNSCYFWRHLLAMSIWTVYISYTAWTANTLYLLLKLSHSMSYHDYYQSICHKFWNSFLGKCQPWIGGKEFFISKAFIPSISFNSNLKVKRFSAFLRAFLTISAQRGLQKICSKVRLCS